MKLSFYKCDFLLDVVRVVYLPWSWGELWLEGAERTVVEVALVTPAEPRHGEAVAVLD